MTAARSALAGIRARLTGDADHGHSVEVTDERAARGAAGLLLVPGVVAFTAALALDDPALLRPFGMLATIDLLLRVVVGPTWSPTLVLAALAVRRQRPEWVGAPAKRFAWAMGLGMSMLACLAMGWLALPLVATALCGVCLTLIALEALFGICVGCALQRRLSRTPPELCPGGVCER